jgi:hypothetical protein
MAIEADVLESIEGDFHIPHTFLKDDVVKTEEVTESEYAPMGLNFLSKNELAVKDNSYVGYLFQ